MTRADGEDAVADNHLGRTFRRAEADQTCKSFVKFADGSGNLNQTVFACRRHFGQQDSRRQNVVRRAFRGIGSRNTEPDHRCLVTHHIDTPQERPDHVGIADVADD